MKVPWVNLLVFGLVLLQGITGYFGFTTGHFPERWILWLHSIGAYALIVLLYWKGMVILDAWRRKTVWSGARMVFTGMLGLLLATLLSGLWWSFTGPVYWRGFSLISVHIYLAIPLLALIAWHSWRMRFVWRLPEARGRRLFVNMAGSLLAGMLLWRGAVGVKKAANLSGNKRRFTGSYETGSYSGVFPRVSWIADRPPPVDAATWRLRIDGQVLRQLTVTYDELLAMSWESKTAVLDCTGGWYSAQVWRGVPLQVFLDMAGLKEEAASVTVTAVSGYRRRFTLAEGKKYLLATHVAGAALAHGHGFPLRLVAADQRGVNWIKWINHITVNHTGKWLQMPLPLQ
jgi:hypothetical protein